MFPSFHQALYSKFEYNGSSIVDYALVSCDVKKNVRSFQVLELCRLSDHCPLSLSINISSLHFNKKSNNQLERAPKQYPWNSKGDPIKFFGAQNSSEITKLSKEIVHSNCTSKNDVATINSKLVELYQRTAELINTSNVSATARAKKIRVAKIPGLTKIRVR